MENTFNNGFSLFKFCTKIAEAFPSKESLKPNVFSVLWVREGMIDLLVDDVMISLDVNQMIFFTPIKYVKILENHSKVSILQFNRAFYCIRENDHEVSCNGILYFGTQGIPMIHLEGKELKSFDRLIGVLREEFEIIDPIQEEMLRTILKKWLIKSTRILKKQNNYLDKENSKAELLRQFKIILEKYFKELHQVSDYAKLLNKSPKTIANQFKILGQESPSMMIQNRLITEAKRYLLYSQLSIKEIAFKLGFNDASSFSHFFKTKTSLAPKEFREIYFNK